MKLFPLPISSRVKPGADVAVAFVAALLLLAAALLAPAADAAPVDPPVPDSLAAEAVSVQVNVRRLGNTLLDALVVDDDVYLPIRGLFSFLKIKAIPSADGDTISGFFIDEENRYTIDMAGNTIEFGGARHPLATGDIIWNETEAFVRRRVLVDVFGLDCTFSFRSLDVKISCDRELPAIRDMIREKAHQGLVRRKEQTLADRAVGTSGGLFHAGTVDWTLSSLRSTESHAEYYAVSAGATLFGGDADASLVGAIGSPIDWGKLPWHWRWVDLGNPHFTQATIGGDIPLPFQTFSGTLAGVSVTNRPINRRRGFGTYHVVGHTEPGWMVDLYINGELATFAPADASGHYDFEVPLTYGSTAVGLKFFGPWGEEREREMLIQVPFTFLPAKEIEYTAAVGRLHGLNSRTVGQLMVQRGITENLTVGGGFQYVREFADRPVSGYVGASFRATEELLLTADYVAGYRTRAILSYASPRGFSLEGSYTHYHTDQLMGAIGGLDVRKIAINSPIRFSPIPMSGRLSFSQDLADAGNYVITGEGGLNAALGGLQTNLAMNTVLFRRDGEMRLHSLRSTLSVSKGIFWQMVLRSQFQYDLATSRPLSLGVAIDRGVFDLGYLTLSIERTFLDKRLTAQLDFRYDLPFAATRLSIIGSNRDISLDQTMHGTLSFDEATGDLLVGNRSSVGRGGVTVRSFLDENNNGTFDPGEQAVPNLDVKVTGGRVVEGEKGVTRIMDLEPYDSCTVRFVGGGLEYLSWQPKFHSASVFIDPNHFKELAVPIVVAGEVAGTISRRTPTGLAPQGGIRVIFEPVSGGAVADSALTFSNGEYNFMGLPPGKYRAYIDPMQLDYLKLVAEPDGIDFELKSLPQGDLKENLNFVLEGGEEGR